MKLSKPLVLSILASVGVVGTSVSAAYASKKAVEKKTKQEKAVCYIPTVCIGTATIVCIFSSYGLSQKQQESLIAAYSLLQSSFNDYKQAVIDIHGQKAHEQVMQRITAERYDPDHIIYANDFDSVISLSVSDTDLPEVVRTFYDPASNRYFESILSHVIEAEYHLNRNFMLGGEVTIDDFYDFLGLKPLRTDVPVGWQITDDIYWIDFNHSLTTLDDGMEVITIDMIFEPGPLE